MSDYTDVGHFHRKFGLDTSDDQPGPCIVTEELYEFRRKFMQEELDEFIEGWENGDEAKMADSLVDLVYVALGTAHLFGYPWQDLWNEVQRANMEKTKATTGMMGPRENAEWDVIKPEGWKPPDIDGVLRRHGWQI
jgi:predicted HAD superfamily Cof-like phosphohydrolase